MKKQHFYWLVTLLLVAVCTILIWQRYRPSISHSASLLIAANLPLTGDLSVYGQSIREGAELAIQDAETETKKTVKFDWQDNRSQSSDAVTVFQIHQQIKPDVYVSGVKPQTMAILDEVSRLGIPHFVWIFDAQINKGLAKGDGANLRTWVNYKIEPPVYVEYAKKVAAKKVAVAYVQLPHSTEEIEEILCPQLESQQIECLRFPFAFGESEFKGLAAKMADSKPDLFILNGFQNDLIALVRALRGLEVIKDGNLIGTYDMLDAAKVLGANEIEGLRCVAPKFVLHPLSDGYQQWRQRFMAKYQKEPLYTHAYAYDMANALMKAALTFADRTSKPEPGEILGTLKGMKSEGITGPIEFDTDGDLKTPVAVGVFRDGTLHLDTK